MTFPPFTQSRWCSLALAAATAAMVALLSGCSGQTYSCGNGLSNHCYGAVSWSGSPKGFSMQMTPEPLTSGDIFIDDEGWLTQNSVPACPGKTCWVETGIDDTNLTQQYGYGTTVYFWASGTAAGGFMYYYLGDVPNSDMGNWIQFEVVQDPSTSSTWDVSISNPSTSTLLYFAQCTSNPMTPDTVIEGQELAGSNSAQAPIVLFTHNEEYKGGKWTDRTSNGTVFNGQEPAFPGPPPNANWWPGSKPSSSPNGGIFFTDCC